MGRAIASAEASIRELSFAATSGDREFLLASQARLADAARERRPH
jgi:hypothetical protein